MIIVSACLLGMKTRFDGGDNRDERFTSLMEKNLIIPVCPEQLGGLPTPRKRVEMRGGEGRDILKGRGIVVTEDGNDFTKEFRRGAEEVRNIARQGNIKFAILKEDSPSCGSKLIYDGTFSRAKIKGSGITTAVLEEEGIAVYNENNCSPLLEDINNRKMSVYIGVVGGADCSAETFQLARKTGRLLAQKGALIICGGRGGVMEAVSKGANEAGGFSIGVLPGSNRGEGNPYLNIALPTGMGDGRNAIIARSAHGVIALDGGYGTLSEIALARKMGRQVIGLRAWGDIIPEVRTPEEAVEKIFSLLK